MPGSSAPDASFWRGKRVVVTGHTGFKGSWMTLWLTELGARVCGISLPPPTAPNLYTELCIGEMVDDHMCDITNSERLRELVSRFDPDIVIHLAAQSLVRESYANPLDTFSTNIQGTANVLDAVRHTKKTKVALMVTTDKVYQNNEWVYPYRETDRLGGNDPYSASKAASELVIDSYRESFLTSGGIVTASARAGNVIGGGDWAADRLIPDAMRAWQNNVSLSIRNPWATRPWQHVLDPISGYLKLIERLWFEPILAGAYNLGPAESDASVTVKDVIQLARAYFQKGDIKYSNEQSGPKEANLLALDVSKARKLLSIESVWNLEYSLKRTITWYKDFYSGESAKNLCISDIAAYESDT